MRSIHGVNPSDVPTPDDRWLVVMGVAGSGKTTVGQRLAGELGLDFVDGDDLHPAANVAKMSAGQPLDDDDRAPWLERVAEVLVARDGGVVVACSALKRAYRELIRERCGGAGRPLTFLYLEVTPEVARQRVADRPGHFMGADMVDSQFAALESPIGEPDVVVWEN